MVIDVNLMYNYQIVCNESSIIGMIHSYNESLISLQYKNTNFKLERKNKRASIVKAVLIEE